MRNLSFFILAAVVGFIGGCTESRGRVGVSYETERVGNLSLQSRAIAIIREGLADENAFVRDRAIMAASVTGRKEFAPLIVQALKSDAVAIKFGAIEAIGDMKYSAAQRSLRRLLNDTNENIKIAAAYAMTRIGKGDFSEIIRRSLKSKNSTIRANAVMLLGKLGNKRDVGLLYQVISADDSDDKVRIRAVEAIAALGDNKIYRGKCWPLLISKYHDDRIMGIRAMAKLGTAEAKNAIKTMLYDDILEVRLYAAGQLGELGDVTGQEEVVAYLQSKSPNKDKWSVADETAVTAIGQIGTEALAGFLPEFLDSRNKVIRLSAAQSALLFAQ
ncbi:MAG: HEAT repeat domain-containing protein [Planctomycetota bacterium]|jgi:HEAT repeat protein